MIQAKKSATSKLTLRVDIAPESAASKCLCGVRLGIGPSQILVISKIG